MASFFRWQQLFRNNPSIIYENRYNQKMDNRREVKSLKLPFLKFAGLRYNCYDANDITRLPVEYIQRADEFYSLDQFFSNILLILRDIQNSLDCH